MASVDPDPWHIEKLITMKEPPGEIKEIIQAVLLLLGENEAETSKWQDCVKIIKNLPSGNGINEKMTKINISKLNEERRLKAKSIFSKFSEVKNAFADVDLLCKWGLDVIRAHEKKVGSADSKTESVKSLDTPSKKGVLNPKKSSSTIDLLA